MATILVRIVDEVDRALDAHVDQGRPATDEGRAVLREALEVVARSELGDKVVFVDTDTFPTIPPEDES